MSATQMIVITLKSPPTLFLPRRFDYFLFHTNYTYHTCTILSVSASSLVQSTSI
nr:MAG TPA: hypothetical protein [Caudoviricetes sp.]